MSENIWSNITKSDQYRAVNDLIIESNPGSNYYTLLVLSSVIIAAGLLLANSAILIGGMLVTPLLTPILLISLTMTLGRPFLLKKTFMVIIRSVVVVFAVSFLFGLIFAVPEDREFFSSVVFNNTISSAFLYFVVAFASGIAATFAWVRKKVTNMLPGISIAVSLVPPIALVGVWLAQMDIENARFFLMVFLLNFIGITMGSMIVFSMLKFYKVDDEVTADFNTLERQKNREEIERNLEEKKLEQKEQYENIDNIK
ncbi:DUF389 domain-containing protein [Candidatus Parcubacteria bacterium]|nr:DUF389 domain-containing protein [Candidatus Parcubacteria bacterium]